MQTRFKVRHSFIVLRQDLEGKEMKTKDSFSSSLSSQSSLHLLFVFLLLDFSFAAFQFFFCRNMRSREQNSEASVVLHASVRLTPRWWRPSLVCQSTHRSIATSKKLLGAGRTTRSKCIATRNKCLTSSNKKATRNKCHASSDKCHATRSKGR